MTAVLELMVSLVNGTQVPWSEFRTWSSHKQRMSLLPRTSEHRARISQSRQGMTFTPEHRAKMSIARQARVTTPETRAKMSATRKGKPMTPEHKAAISAAKQAKSLSKNQA